MYIEAFKEAHVREAIRGLRNVLVSKGVRLVPLNEMVVAINVNTKAKKAIGTPPHSPLPVLLGATFATRVKCMSTIVDIQAYIDIYCSYIMYVSDTYIPRDVDVYISNI